MSPRRPTRLYFLHIPKTAGSSVTDWLRAQVPPGAWCPPKDWTQLVQRQPDRLSRYTLFCGHFGWGLDEVVGRRLGTVTVFRDPLQRTFSHYRHVYRDPAHPRHRTVSGQSFAQFVADADNWPMIENFQARYLVRNVVDPRTLFGRLDPDPVKLNRLSTTTEEARHLYSRDHVRKHAHRHFGQLAVVGTTTELDGFLQRVAECWGWPGCSRPRTPRVNVDPDGGQADAIADPQTCAIVRSLTTIDQELFDRASAV